MAQRPAREFERCCYSDVPSQRDLDVVAHRAGDNWRSLLTHLGVDLPDIQSFLSKNGNNTKNACFEGLVSWVSGGVAHSEPVVFETLFEALRDASMAGVVSELKKRREARLALNTVDEGKPDQTQKANVQLGNRTLQPQTATKPMKPPAGSTLRPLQQLASAAPKGHSSNTQTQAKDPSPADQKLLDHQSISLPYPQNVTCPIITYKKLFNIEHRDQYFQTDDDPSNDTGPECQPIQKASSFINRIQWFEGRRGHSFQGTARSIPAGYEPHREGYDQPVDTPHNQDNMPYSAANTHGQQPSSRQGGRGGPGRVKSLHSLMDPAYQDMLHARPGQYQGHSSPNPTNNPPSHNAISPPRERLAERMKIMSTPIPKLSGTEGPQAFQLPTNQLLHDSRRRLAVKAVGTSRRDSPSHKVVMLVGATGAGKTTLINSMANYIYGVRWVDDFRLNLIRNEEGIFSRIHSQTKWITAYTIYWDPESALQYDLTVIDTPGFGEYKGIAAGKALVAQIQDLFSLTPDQHGIDQIHCIGLVTQASLPRLTSTQNVFDSILSIFGTDVGKNILLFTTFADGKKPPVIEAFRAATHVPFPVKGIFTFNNSALFADNRDENVPSSQGSQNRREDSSDDDSFNEFFWKMGIKSFNKFFKQLDGMEVNSLQLTKEVLEERQQLETILNGIQPQIQAGLAKMADLEQIKADMEKLEAAIIANKDYTFTVEVPRMTKVDLKPGEYELSCLKCNHVCHSPCDIPSDKNKAHCWAMDKDGNCRICIGKCCWNCHCSQTYRFECSTVMKVMTSDDLKKKYDDAMSDKSRHETMKANITKELKGLSRQILAMVCKAQASLKRLEEIALKPNPLTDIEYLELLIESEKYQANKGWMDRVHALKGFLKQAKFLANMRKKGATITTNPLVDDDMFKKTWWEDLMDRWHL